MKNNQMKTFVILFAMVLTLQLSTSHAAVNTFVKKVRGGGSVVDAIQTTDGNYISVSEADETHEAYLVRKVNPSGKLIWERTVSAQVEFEFGGYWGLESIAQLNEGYVLVGWAVDDDVTPSVGIVVVLRPDGTVNWTKWVSTTTSFGATGSFGFGSVASTPDGGFIVKGGGFEVPSLLMKFAPDGSIQWQKTFSNSFRFLSTYDHGFILAGKISNGASIMKVDDSGNIVWSRILNIEGFSLKTLGDDPDHGIIIAGRSKDSNTLTVIRLDSNGQINWKAKYSLKGPFGISGVVPTSDGGFAVTGKINGNGFVLKINAQKRLVFQRTIDFQGSEEKALSLFPTSEGGFFLIGASGKNDQLVLRLNSDGLVPGCRYFHDLNSKAVPAGSVKVGSSNVTSPPLIFQVSSSLDVTSTSSRHSTSTVCQ